MFWAGIHPWAIRFSYSLAIHWPHSHRLVKMLTFCSLQPVPRQAGKSTIISNGSENLKRWGAWHFTGHTKPRMLLWHQLPEEERHKTRKVLVFLGTNERTRKEHCWSDQYCYHFRATLGKLLRWGKAHMDFHQHTNTVSEPNCSQTYISYPHAWESPYLYPPHLTEVSLVL